MRQRKISIARAIVLMLALTAAANLAVCLWPDPPLGRIGNDPLTAKDPAAAAALEFVRSIRDADHQSFASLLPAATSERLQVEWTLYMNIDLLKTFTDAAVFSDADDEPGSGSTRKLLLQINGPFGTFPVHCRVTSAGDRRWAISQFTPPSVSELHWPSSSVENSVFSDLLYFRAPIGPTAQASVVARLTSKEFTARALSTAGLDDVIGPELLPQMWAVGWSRQQTTLHDGWSGRPTSPTVFVRAIAAPSMLRPAVECLAKAEAVDTVLKLEPALKPNAIWPLLRESFGTGDDEVTIATLQRLAADPASPVDKIKVDQLISYLQAHPAKPAGVAAAWGMHDIGGGMTGDPPSDEFRRELLARMAASGFPLNRSRIDPDDLEDERQKAFDQIVPESLWKE